LGTLLHIAKKDDPGFKATKTSIITTTTDSATGTTSVTETTNPESIFDGVSDVYESIINGKRQAIEWPWPQLSKLSKSLINGSVTVLCGSPGASKSFMLLQACLFWHQAGVKVALYALEEDREFHLMRVLAQITGKPELSPSGMDWVKDHPDEVRDILKTNGDLLGSFGKRIWQRESTTMTLVEAAGWVEERAKDGCRIIAIDPITIVESKEPWIDDKRFIGHVGKIATDYKCSVIVVSHPVKSKSNPDMSQLAGSTAYSRFVQNILWLDHENEEQQSEIMESDLSICEVPHNRTLHILKSRHGRGSGKRLAMKFNDSLCLEELGLIVSDSQGNDHQENLNHRADLRFKTAEANEKAARARERSAEINKVAVETAERGKTEREKMKLEAKTILPLDNNKQS
jgi:RecA-family ATPase